MELNLSTQLIIDFLLKNKLWNFLKNDKNIYIGGSLPFMCLSDKILNIDALNVGDIDIYTTNCPLLFRNINKTFNISNIVKTGVNVKFNIDNIDDKQKYDSKIPIQIITSPFENFESDVLDEYDCGMVSVGFHPYTSKFIIHPKFTLQYEKKIFEAIHERSYPSRIVKLTQRAKELFDAKLIEVKLDSNSDYRPYWKNKQNLNSINNILPSPPYTQLYANKYYCNSCKEKQEYLICKLCQSKMDNLFVNSIKFNNFNIKYKRIVVFGGLNGLGKIIADEIMEIGENKINLVRTGRNGGNESNTYPFNLEDYLLKLKSNDNLIKTKAIISDKLMDAIVNADLIIFNSYQTLEGDQSIWNTYIDTFDANLSEHRFKINCWGYVGLFQEILSYRKKFIQTKSLGQNIQDQVFVWIDANESTFESKLSDGKHLELNMAKTACKQIFYTNASIMAGLGIIFLCYDCGWCSYHGISIDKIDSKSQYLVPPKLTSKALLAYLSELDIDKLFEDKKFIHDITFYKCVKNLNIDYNSEENENENDEKLLCPKIDIKKNDDKIMIYDIKTGTKQKIIITDEKLLCPKNAIKKNDDKIMIYYDIKTGTKQKIIIADEIY